MSLGSAIISGLLTFTLLFSSSEDPEPDLPDVISNSTTEDPNMVPDVSSIMALQSK